MATTASTLKARLQTNQVNSAANPRPANQAVAVVKPLPALNIGSYLAASKLIKPK
ncbi:MAG: hypothetical protein KGL39_26025 [Patescibacteria group bacterium]|nr:hypothetical protein [Patescibacteria group bacterium]